MPFFTITHIMISIYAIGLIISAVSFLLVGTLQPSDYQKELSHTIVFATIMQLGYWFYSTGNTFEEMLQAQKLIYLGGCMVPYYLTLLFATFCRVEIHKGSRLTMYFGSLLMAIISMTCDLHPLMHKAVEMVDVNGIQRLNITAGPLMYWYNFRCLVYFVTMLWLAIRNYRKSSRRRNLHTVILMQTATLPYTLFLIEAIFKPNYSLTPIGLTLGIFLLLSLVFIANIYDLNASTKELIFSKTQNAIIMFSVDGSFQSCNELAAKMFPELGTLSVNESMNPDTLQLFEKLKKGEQKDFEFEGKIYECQSGDVDRGKLIVGSILALVDVTEHRKYEKLLEQYQEDLEQTVQQKTEHIQAIQDHIIMSMSDIMENRDGSTGGHVKRTSVVVGILTDYLMSQNHPNVTHEFSKTVVHTAPMHDLGKLAIADSVLCKNGKLTDEEFDIMKTHTVKGRELVDKVLRDVEEDYVISVSENIALYHHEKWNGKGYPENLSGEDIPLEARLMAIADVYDALVSKRCYKESLSFDLAYKIMIESFGTHFDPSLQPCFEACREKIEAYYAQQ